MRIIPPKLCLPAHAGLDESLSAVMQVESRTLSSSAWLTVLVLLLLFVIFIVINAIRSRNKLTWREFMISAAQAFFVASAIITSINLLYFWANGELDLPQPLIEPTHPILAASIFLIALSIWAVYECLRRPRR